MSAGHRVGVNVAQFLAALLLLAHCHTARSAPCCVPIELDVKPNIVGGRPVLSIRVTNRSAEPVSFYVGLGPWIGPEMIQLVAMQVPDGAVILNKERAVLDPSPAEVVLAPGASKTSNVKLESVYPELLAELCVGRRDVVLFWTYQMELIDERLSERVGGWLFLPKDFITRKKR